MVIIELYGGILVGNQTGTEEIITFLERVKTLVSAGQYDFVPRRKNMQALARQGITIADAKDEILGLSASDYYKGPKLDLDPGRSGDIWEFKKNIGNLPFYVKVKIVREGSGEILKCLSFHEDDFAQE